MSLSKQQYKQFYDTVGNEMGWDFSKLKVTTEGEDWELYQEVQKTSKKSDLLLDIGTGGGEKALALVDTVHLVVGIDISDGMVETAEKNRQKKKAGNARFYVMDADAIRFPDGFFDIISCRHSDFNPSEVYRLLAPGGYFMTQQVGESDKQNLSDHFGRGQSDNPDGTLMKQYTGGLKNAGFAATQEREYDATEYYQRPEDLIFLLKHTPIIPHFGQEEGDFEKLESFIEDHMTEKGIRTNSKRFLITARK